MISNKEKRLSHAPADAFHISDVGQVVGNSIHPPNYGLIKNNHNHHQLNNVIRDPNLKKLIQEHRNSHSLNHDFSQLYISNLKNQIDSHTNVKSKVIDPNHTYAFEEMSSYKKEALECKKQMFQMEKSISFWSECTEYWRNKWRKTRDEKNKLSDEVKQLKSRINRLEHQLQTSDEKRLRLGSEVNFLNEELSRYMYRYEDETSANNSRRLKHHHQQQHPQLHYNSDRRVDYRKKHRRKKELLNLLNNKDYSNKLTTAIPHNESSSSDTDSRDNPAQPHSYTMIQQKSHEDQIVNSLGKSPQSSLNPKIVFRHQQHERLFDKKIMNKKRFSQVVMLDEDEIFQMNKEIQTIPRNNNNGDSDTLKVSHSSSVQQYSDLNDTLNTYTHNQKHRYMDYVPEDVEEEDSFDDRIKPGQFFSDDLDFESIGISGGIGSSNTNLASSNNKNMDFSNLSSTMATNNSESCPNVGSVSHNDANGDSDGITKFETNPLNESEQQTQSNDDDNGKEERHKKNQAKHETDDDEV